MKRITHILFLLLTAAITTVSCTEEIQLDLDSAAPKLVIEGVVTNEPGPYTVRLSKSKAYYEDNTFAMVTADFVVISDNAGNTDTLQETSPGIYQTNTLQGTEGRTYHLQASVEGVLYESYSSMPAVVSIDSIAVQMETGFGGDAQYVGYAAFRDPAGIDNQYRVQSVLNNVRNNSYLTANDRLTDGKLRIYPVPSDSLVTGDTLLVQLWSIDNNVYEYFRKIGGQSFGPPADEAAPANPGNNITPEALGYFSAHSINSKWLVVP